MGEKIRNKANPAKVAHRQRKSKLKATYGITIEKYDQMFIDQGGCCAGCRLPQSSFKKRLDVDHDHATGNIRGLLCLNCNTALGKVKDNIKTLERLANYLKVQRTEIFIPSKKEDQNV